MALTEEQKNKMREELDKLTPDELKDLNIALRDDLDDQTTAARTERQKAIYNFLHPKKTDDKKTDDEPTDDEPPERNDVYFERLKNKFKTR